MSDISITHACGHARDYNLDQSKDREWWKEFIPQTICPKCFSKLLKRRKFKYKEKKNAST